MDHSRRHGPGSASRHARHQAATGRRDSFREGSGTVPSQIRSSESNKIQRLLEIGQEIAPVFDAYRDAHQAVSDAGLRGFFFGEPGMRGRFGMTNQRFHASE